MRENLVTPNICRTFTSNFKLNVMKNTMNENTIWEGRPSHWSSFTFYLTCIPLTLFFGIGIIMAIWRFLNIQNHKITITSQRILEETGVLSKNTNELELFRVKDLQLNQPFILRILGLSNILLATSDASSPYIVLKGLNNGKELKEQLRVAVENRRDSKKVREFDI